MKGVFAFVILVSVICKSTALTCYACDAVGTGNCFNISQYSGSIGRCSSETRSYQSQIQQASGKYVEEIDARAINIKCFEYQQHYYQRNVTEVHRGCILNQYADAMCDSLNTNSQLYYYNLTKCKVCQEDFCNSAHRGNMGAMLLVLAAIVSANIA